jgi:uncharacterized protein (DUF4415 family)
MPKSQLIDDDSEVRELTETDLRRFKPAADALPATLRKKLGVRGPQKTPIKVPTTIRVDADVLAALKASGKGWQTRVNEALRDWLKTHSAV